MKKTISLLLALVMLLSLAACSSEPEKSGEELAFEAANALLESGDYEGAIAAFSQIGMYQQISAKIQEAQAALDAQSTAFLQGKWMNVTGWSCTLEFYPDGKGKMINSDDAYNLEYSYSDGQVSVNQPLFFMLRVEEKDGIIHLISEGVEMDLVSEADYEKVGPQQVEITMDNWDTYFEMVQGWNHYMTPFGDVEWQNYGCALVLKPEYLDRMPGRYEDISVDFQIEYDYAMFYVENPMTLDILVTDRVYHPDWDWTNGTESGTGTVYGNINNYENLAESSLMYNQYGTFIPCDRGYTEDDGIYAYAIMTRADVTNVQGTLMLLP